MQHTLYVIFLLRKVTRDFFNSGKWKNNSLINRANSTKNLILGEYPFGLYAIVLDF